MGNWGEGGKCSKLEREREIALAAAKAVWLPCRIMGEESGRLKNTKPLLSLSLSLDGVEKRGNS